MITKPMLAEKVEDYKTLRFPLIATPKLDGIRCLMIGGRALTRSFKGIPNNYIRENLEGYLPDGLDGEILIGANFQDVGSGVMSQDGEPDFEYHVFDFVDSAEFGASGLDQPYEARIRNLRRLVPMLPRWVRYVHETRLESLDDLDAYLANMRERGEEGACLRLPEGRYKCGRSTLREHLLLKVKFFDDSEAIITGFEEATRNDNPKEKDNFGNTKRSSHKANKVLKGTTGKILARDIHSGQLIKVGTGKGFNDALKQEMWLNPEKFIGRMFKYQFQGIGTKDSPRIPSFQGFRDERDMS